MQNEISIMSFFLDFCTICPVRPTKPSLDQGLPASARFDMTNSTWAGVAWKGQNGHRTAGPGNAWNGKAHSNLTAQLTAHLIQKVRRVHAAAAAAGAVHLHNELAYELAILK